MTSPIEGIEGSASRSGVPGGQLPRARSVLAVVARPGDESFYLGAVLDYLRAHGARVGMLVFSLGEASPYNSTVERLESVRPFEFELASFVLRAAHRLLVDYPDGGLGSIPAAELVERITRMIRESSADLLLTLDADNGDDPLVAAVCGAGRAAGIPVLAWTSSADAADYAVRVSRKVQKRAMRTHRSQAAAEPEHFARFDAQGDQEWLRWLVPPS